MIFSRLTTWPACSWLLAADLNLELSAAWLLEKEVLSGPGTLQLRGLAELGSGGEEVAAADPAQNLASISGACRRAGQAGCCFGGVLTVFLGASDEEG